MSISKALAVSLQLHSIICFQKIHVLSDPLISIGKVMIDYAPKYPKELNRIWKWGILVEPNGLNHNQSIALKTCLLDMKGLISLRVHVPLWLRTEGDKKNTKGRHEIRLSHKRIPADTRRKNNVIIT